MSFFHKDKGLRMVCYSPVKGEMIQLEKLNDEAFSSGIMGKGVAFIPNDGHVYAPCDGRVESIHTAKHAISIIDTNENHIMLHMGTRMAMNDGHGFLMHVNENQTIKVGQLLYEFDLKKMAQEDIDCNLALVYLDLPEKAMINMCSCGRMEIGDPIIEIQVLEGKVKI